DRCSAHVPRPFRERLHGRSGPGLAQPRATGRTLLRSFPREFRAGSKRGRELRGFQQPRATSTGRAAPGFDEENRVVAPGAMTKIGVQPVDKARTVVDLLRFDRPLEAM